ncbi:MAG: HAMP domain-containing sensor histidine kinase [Bacillota bacterium]|nr:HAMP domain-containing sensor histidine kinase [Bacillota bacterium]
MERDIEVLFDYTTLKENISSSLKKAGLSSIVIDEVNNIILQEQTQKNVAIEEIKKAVAIYQGQATLGKIINIILHEGRRPLNYFKNQIPNLNFYSNAFLSSPSDEMIRKISDLTLGLSENSSAFVSLFSRLDPLSAKRRDTKSQFMLFEMFQSVISVFENELIDKRIEVNVQCSQSTVFWGWKQDFYTIFTNLIDNSIFWINEKKCIKREISIVVTSSEEMLEITYIDSGPGINSDLLESGVIFEPQFTTKPNGTGLGLSISGEAASRNGLALKAIQNDNGAHFQIYTEERIDDV